jgi:diguanylate cyclase (GGDEF)-like protein/PAS domain S-box-containing protein
MNHQRSRDRLGIGMPQWVVLLKRKWNNWIGSHSESPCHLSSGCEAARLALLSSAATLCDEGGVILAVNSQFEDLSGYSAQELIGQLAPALRSGFYDPGLIALIRQAVVERGVWQGQVLGRHKSGRMLVEQLTVCREQGEGQPHLLCLVGLTQEGNSLHGPSLLSTRVLDPLTGLLDRPGFYAELEHQCQSGSPFGLLSLDLKNFCNINTQFDHQTGDNLLQQLAERLRLLAGSRELLGRVGGDGFALLLPGVTTELELASWAEQVLARVHQRFEVGPRKLRLSGTVSGALWPRDGQDFNQLLRHTDLALFEARRQQRNYLCFSEQMQQAIAEREVMQRHLLQAINDGDITLVYQPIWDNRLARVAKLEALARWQHPELGAVSPVDFIPLAEQCGLIQLLGEQLLEQACRDLRRLHDAGYDWLQVSVNRSTLEFNTLSADGHEWLSVLAKHQLPPSHLIFEITESIFMEGHEEHLCRIKALRDAGCQIAIDDFGTGFSALNYLRLYPMDLVKIDRSFVQQIPLHTQDRLLLQGLISIVHNLGMQLVVEGVEREEQQAFICEQGCSFTQGYLFSKPLVWLDLLSYLQRHHPSRATRCAELTGAAVFM